MKRLIVSIAATLALAAVAMPTNDEVKKAVPTVKELMNPLVAEFRSRKKSAVEVGETAMAYAKEADTEGAKFLLLKGAVWYFAQAKDDAKAVAAIAALGEQVKDLPPEVLRNDILKPAIDHVSEQNVPGLFAQFRSASAQMEIAKLASSIRRNRADEPTRRRYAELLVVTGDWKAALDIFAKLDDAKVVQAAKDEIGGTTLAPAGDFWWNYTPTEATAADAIKAHAVALYRKAIAAGELTGLKKVVAEKRIASVPFADIFTVSGVGGAGRAASVSAAPRDGVPSNALYCVIDLSAGPNASKYPVSYLAAEPKGGWTDEYKTKKLVLRRIEPGKFKMSGEYEVTLTKPFYCGVFEVTQKQYELVTGGNPSEYKGDMRPVENISWNMIRGDSATYNWPSSVNVDSSTFMGKIQTRTGLNFDLPTEAQWEYACRAGTTSKYNNSGDSVTDLKKLGRFMLNQKERSFNDNNESFAKHEPDGKGGYSTRHTVVGSYMPNAWGLYDMHGNVWEWCRDWRGDLSSGVTDPVGSSSGSYRVLRGGCWDSPAAGCTSSTRNNAVPSWVRHIVGFRLCMNPEGPVGTSPRGSGTLAASSTPSANDLYCVIDLSAGPNASKYPVSYLAAEPKGGWTDEYKTKKLVLRRIEPGKFKMGGEYEVTLTKPFYCGVFEVTQKQYELVTGKNPSEFKGDMRPVEKVSYDMIRGKNAGAKWPASSAVDSSSFIGKIRERTGIEGFDLPTEAQWEYACRAGTTGKYNNGGDSEADLKKLGRFALNQKARGYEEADGSFSKHKPDGKGGCWDRHTVVGSYVPNAWGLYDMHGNVWEWCLDWHGHHLSGGVTDPQGPSSGVHRVRRGGSWSSHAELCASSGRGGGKPWGENNSVGFRLFRTLSN